MVNNTYYTQMDMLWTIFSEVPDATAYIRGSSQYPMIKGVAQFYQLAHGVLMVVEVMGLPSSQDECKKGIHALHIHDGGECSGNASDPFADAKAHYNPNNCEHPYHAGDLPPLFENQGYALSVFFTDRFQVKDVIGRTVIVHENIDDFSTQPSGNAGTKIACGEITASKISR